MRALRSLATALVAFALLAGTAEANAPDVERVDLVTHVFPETGHRVVAVAGALRRTGLAPSAPRSQ